MTAVVDLGQPAERLLDAVRRAVGDLEIGLLVANAAWSPVGPFLDVDLAALLAAIDINCRAPVVLAHELGAPHGRAGARRDHRHVVARGRDRRRERRAVLGDEGVRSRARRGPLVRAARPRRRRHRDPARARRAHRGGSPPNRASGELQGVMEPADVVRDALAALGTTPSIAAGAANRAAEAMFRSMARRDVIELMSGITSQLVPPPAPFS